MLSTKKYLSMPIQQLVNVAMCTCLTSTLASFQQQLRREAAFIGNHWQVSLPVLRPWFTAIPVGKNSLGKVVSEMFCAAGIKEKKTNHSLRAAGVSQSFEAGVDEKIIQRRSGHRSTDALRMYERITPAQQQAVSNILTSGEKKKFRDEMRVVSAQPGPVCAQIPNLHIPGQTPTAVASMGSDVTSC